MRCWLVLLLVAASVVTADQVTKYLAVRDLTALFERAEASSFGDKLGLFYRERGIEHLRGQPIHVFSWWSHAYSENPGAAFGLLAGRGPMFRLLFFGAVTLLAITFVLVMAKRAEPDRAVVHVALGGILGGVLGNFSCRLTRGYVIDFIDWRAGHSSLLHWPAFNVADVGITLGVLVLLALTIKEVIQSDE